MPVTLWRLPVSNIQALGQCSQLKSQKEKGVKIINTNRASKNSAKMSNFKEVWTLNKKMVMVVPSFEDFS